MLKLTTDRHEASRGFFATAELLVVRYISCSSVIYLRQRRRYMSLLVFVCLSVCQHEYSKTRAWIWMKCCMSTDVGTWTWTNWLTFEPDPDHSPDAATKSLFSISYRLRNFAALPRLPASCAATRNFTWENPTRIGIAPPERAVILQCFCLYQRRIEHSAVTGVWRPNAWTSFDEIWYITAY